MQVAQLATVRKLLESRFAQLEESLALKRDRGDDALRTFLLSHQGLVTMSSLRLALDGMAAEERTQNERRIQAFTNNQDQVRTGFVLVVGSISSWSRLARSPLARNRGGAAAKRPKPRNAT